MYNRNQVGPRAGVFSRERCYLGSSQKMYWPLSLAWNVSNGKEELYVVDTDNQVVHRVNSDGKASIFCGFLREETSKAKAETPKERKFSSPSGIALSNKDGVLTLFVTEEAENVVKKVTENGKIELFVGKIDEKGFRDGEDSLWNRPTGIAIDSKFEFLYLCDRDNHLIRRIDISTKSVKTICGNIETGVLKDGIGSQAGFKTPEAIAVDYESRFLFVIDTKTNIIRKVNLQTREVSTLCGGILPGFYDARAHEAKFNMPMGIAIDRFGILIVSDSQNHVIRRINQNGDVTTLIGIPERKGIEGKENLHIFFIHF